MFFEINTLNCQEMFLALFRIVCCKKLFENKKNNFELKKLFF